HAGGGTPAIVEPHHLPDIAGLWQGELGLEPAGGRPRAAFPECACGQCRKRWTLGAPRPPRRVHRDPARISSLSAPDQSSVTSDQYQTSTIPASGLHLVTGN